MKWFFLVIAINDPTGHAVSSVIVPKPFEDLGSCNRAGESVQQQQSNSLFARGKEDGLNWSFKCVVMDMTR